MPWKENDRHYRNRDIAVEQLRWGLTVLTAIYRGALSNKTDLNLCAVSEVLAQSAPCSLLRGEPVRLVLPVNGGVRAWALMRCNAKHEEILQ